MIQHFSKQPPTSVGGGGDGSFENPYYWSEIAEGNAVTDLDKINCANTFKYVKVNLTEGVSYTINCSAADFDTYLEIQDLAGNILDYNDDNGSAEYSEVYYTPDESGDFIICYRNYGDEGAGGQFGSARITPAPNPVEVPSASLEYTTSSGFNAFGRPLKYRSASDAGLGMPEPVFYVPLAEKSDTAATGQPLSEGGYMVFEVHDGIPCVRPTAPTFIKSVNAFTPSKDGAYTVSGWVDYPESCTGYAFGIGGSDAGSRLFCIYLSTYAGIGVNIGGTSYPSDVMPGTGWHHFACTYDGKGIVKLYIDGTLVRTDAAVVTISNYDCFILNRPDLSSNNAIDAGSHVSSVRVFTSALSDNAIAQLATEFQRCVSVTCPDCGETYCATCDTHNCTSGGGSETPTDPDDPVVPDIPAKDDDICQWGTCTEVHSYQCASCLGYFCGNHLAGPYDSPNGEIYYCLACEQGNI